MHILYRQSPDVSFINIIVDFLVHCGVCVCVCVCVCSSTVSAGKASSQHPAVVQKKPGWWLSGTTLIPGQYLPCLNGPVVTALCISIITIMSVAEQVMVLVINREGHNYA